jgi:oligopeptide/dipeptide ABC transporter ATP-binding protein
MIMKLIPPTSGEILFDGQSVSDLSLERERAYRRQVQMVFQDPFSSLNPRMTVGSIIGYPMRIQNAYPGPARDARIRELLELVGLSRYQANWYPHEFSGGERQRVGIATALALNPKFVFCDEPVSSLDVSAQAQILNLLKDVRREFDLTILIVTHNLSVVEYLSDRVVVMYLGKIVEIAATADLYRDTLHPYSKALVSAIPTPDPEVERQREQIILRGEIPSPLNPPTGCRFHTRCQEYIGDVCREVEPELREVRPGHFAACHLYSEPAAAPGAPAAAGATSPVA